MQKLALRLILVALAACVLTAPTTASGAKGGRSTAVLLVFDDRLGDGIQSDGLGAYAGVIRDRDGALVVETGDRAVWVDLGAPEGLQPLYDLTITVSTLDGPTATAEFERSTNTGGLAIIMEVAVSRPGSSYVLTSASQAEYWSAYRQRVTGRSPSSGRLVWMFFGYIDLPWSAAVVD